MASHDHPTSTDVDRADQMALPHVVIAGYVLKVRLVSAQQWSCSLSNCSFSKENHGYYGSHSMKARRATGAI